MSNIKYNHSLISNTLFLWANDVPMRAVWHNQLVDFFDTMVNLRRLVDEKIRYGDDIRN